VATAALGPAFLLNTTAGNKTTASFTPTANDLLVAVCGASGTNAGNANTSNVTDSLSGTWTQIVDSGTSVTPRCSIWIRTTLAAASSMTVTAAQGSSSGGGLAVYTVSGMTNTGASAARQSGTAAPTAGTTPSVSLGGAALTTNPIIIGMVNGSSPANLTAPLSPAFTEDGDLGYSTPTTGMEVAHINSGFTASTVTWGSTTASSGTAVAVELDASGPTVVASIRPVVVLQAVTRASSW